MRITEITTQEDVSNRKRRFLTTGTNSLYEVREGLPALHSVEPEMFPGLSVHSISIQATTRTNEWSTELEYR